MSTETPTGKMASNRDQELVLLASEAPGSRWFHRPKEVASAHPVRRGSITWQLNIGRSIEDVAQRAATTPGVIRRVLRPAGPGCGPPPSDHRFRRHRPVRARRPVRPERGGRLTHDTQQRVTKPRTYQHRWK